MIRCSKSWLKLRWKPTSRKFDRLSVKRKDGGSHLSTKQSHPLNIPGDRYRIPLARWNSGEPLIASSVTVCAEAALPGTQTMTPLDDATIGAAAEALLAGNAALYRHLVEELVSAIPGGWERFRRRARPGATYMPLLAVVIEAVISSALEFRIGDNYQTLRSEKQATVLH